MNDQTKAQLQIAQELMETRRWEAELRQKEIDVKTKEHELVRRKQMHDEIMKECSMMREMNIPVEQILKHVQDEKERLGL
ncbi:hypothetical protein Ae201684P_012527 [Aphanomyces euteiches]|uniref:Uncharacterized protein n=1 Tax=Aphanomyces euteiches TaxID=100861 RepID=A0A6G0WZD4_9STRA|nr:hypothetical protein Ae201684_010189 [Aphanomyces euteiches]KAH9076037.1 hypothetical protein Ae201684P_012527 [Aphanomyces euteiches]